RRAAKRGAVGSSSGQPVMQRRVAGQAASPCDAAAPRRDGRANKKESTTRFPGRRRTPDYGLVPYGNRAAALRPVTGSSPTSLFPTVSRAPTLAEPAVV